jgi:hypothetical protein
MRYSYLKAASDTPAYAWDLICQFLCVRKAESSLPNGGD